MPSNIHLPVSTVTNMLQAADDLLAAQETISRMKVDYLLAQERIVALQDKVMLLQDDLIKVYNSMIQGISQK